MWNWYRKKTHRKWRDRLNSSSCCCFWLQLLLFVVATQKYRLAKRHWCKFLSFSSTSSVSFATSLQLNSSAVAVTFLILVLMSYCLLLDQLYRCLFILLHFNINFFSSLQCIANCCVGFTFNLFICRHISPLNITTFFFSCAVCFFYEHFYALHNLYIIWHLKWNLVAIDVFKRNNFMKRCPNWYYAQ